MSDVPVQDASTVLLLRQDKGLRVLMVKRSSRSSFMPSRYVYPGGALEPQDMALAAACVRSWSAQALRDMGADDPLHATALCVAAVRETFEEAGILLATGPSPSGLDVWQAKLNAREVDFAQVLASTGLSVDLDLTLFERWITPTFEHRRFDARFFVAPCPPEHLAALDHAEVVEHQWLGAQQAIDLYRADQIMLAPPTLATLVNLTAFETVDAVLAHARARTQPLPVLLPHRVDGEHGPRLLLPDHPDFPHHDPTYKLARAGARWSEVSMGADKRWALVGVESP